MPAEGSRLNYRVIGFRFPFMQGGVDYKLEIAAGNYSTEDSFKKNIIAKLPVKRNKIIAEVPAFGAPYTWRYSYSLKHTTTRSPLYHFSTLSVPEVETNDIRLRIMQPPLKHTGDYVFMDGNWTLYDINGRPVWYLPGI